jgi:type I restriction enzyme S subunit
MTAATASQSWKRVKMKDIYLGFYDGPHATPKLASEGAVFLGIKNITEDGKLELSEIRYISEEEFPKWTRRVLPSPGDLIFTYEATLNRYAIIPKGFRGCLGRRLALIRPNPDKVDTKFLLYYFFGEDWRKTIATNLIFGSTVDRIPLTNFPNFEISLPPLPIQRKIAGILSAYDDLIENNTRRIEILEEMARSIYGEWFVNFRFPGHEQVQMVDSELGLIPEGWEAAKVEDIYRTSSGGTPSRKNSDFYGGSILWIKTRELNDGFIFETEEKITDLGLQKSSAKVFPPDTVIMAMYGATIGMLGILASPAATNQACCALLKNNSLFSSYYAFLYLLENREKIFSLGMGAAQQNISQQVIKALEILKPSDEVMRKFNELAEPLFKNIKILQQKNINLRQTRDLLLPRLISGEIDVENLDINISQIAA